MQDWIPTASRVLLLAPFLGGCTLLGSPTPAGRPVRDVYEEADASRPHHLRIEAAPVPGAAPRTRPVIYPPKVFAVYVPEHLDPERDMKIGAHWIYLKLRESSWKEEPIDQEPIPTDGVLPGDTAPLRTRLGRGGIERILVPFEGSPLPRPAAENRVPLGGRP